MKKDKEFRNTHPHIKNEGQKTIPRLDELQYEIANEVGFEKIAREDKQRELKDLHLRNVVSNFSP